jgi:hypothetical protein
MTKYELTDDLESFFTKQWKDIKKDIVLTDLPLIEEKVNHLNEKYFERAFLLNLILDLPLLSHPDLISMSVKGTYYWFVDASMNNEAFNEKRCKEREINNKTIYLERLLRTAIKNGFLLKGIDLKRIELDMTKIKELKSLTITI